MSGIVGYIGSKPAALIVYELLKRIEYRGYDSFGIAMLNAKIEIAKKSGRVSDAGAFFDRLLGTTGIGHTRKATIGVPDDRNAHPHTDCTGRIAIVHDGIIKNHTELKQGLIKRGHIFLSDTDSEVIAHLVEEHHQGDLRAAVETILPLLTGSFALLVLCEGQNCVIAARKASPLVIGVGDREFVCASDAFPLVTHTRRILYLEDGDCAELTGDSCVIFNNGCAIERAIEVVDWDIQEEDIGGFAHYMEKEIYEQPKVFYQALQVTQQADDVLDVLKNNTMLTIVASGSSYHVSLLYKYLYESFCNIAVMVEMASEFAHHIHPLAGPVLAITQSGETADTLCALKVARVAECPTIAITNVVGSAVTRIVDATLFTQAGQEKSVAATKSFMAQLAVGMQLANMLAQAQHTHDLNKVHTLIEEALHIPITDAVSLCTNAHSVFFVGRGFYYPLALEGALKMKEVSYIHAAGYAAGELKHGPFALLSPDTPVVALAMPGRTYQVMIANIKEMKARGVPIIAIGVEGDRTLVEIADVCLFLPDPVVLPISQEIIGIAPVLVLLQRLAYQTAVERGCEVDTPRNLAKSVTV